MEKIKKVEKIKKKKWRMEKEERKGARQKGARRKVKEKREGGRRSDRKDNCDKPKVESAWLPYFTTHPIPPHLQFTPLYPPQSNSYPPLPHHPLHYYPLPSSPFTSLHQVMLWRVCPNSHLSPSWAAKCFQDASSGHRTLRWFTRYLSYLVLSYIVLLTVQ